MIFLFSCAAFLTGFLMLLVQFSFSKELLPHFGGAPNVWLASLAFYQIMLSGGYLYSHLLQKYFSLKKQMLIHLSIILIAAILMPVALNKDLMASLDLSGSYSLFLILLTSIGLPFFCLASSSPLIQSWFGNANHKRSHSPYFLYVSSNLGTFGALAVFPFFIEMNFTNLEQLKNWSFLFVVNFLLLIACAILITLSQKNKKEKTTNLNITKTLLTKSNTIKIILYAFIPSAMLSAVTNKMTLDISSMPLLWAIPLGLYFISFSFAFSDNYKIGLGIKALVFGLVGLALFSHVHIYIDFLIILSLLFLTSFVYHKEIYKLSPDKSELTIFYFVLSVGGALGGMFVGILCPLIFNDFHEYFLILVLAVLFIFHEDIKQGKNWPFYQAVLISPFILILAVSHFNNEDGPNVLYKDRTFFGVYKIIEDKDSHGAIHYLMNGSTSHGLQYIDTEELRKTTTSYYSEFSPIVKAINSYKENQSISEAAVIGLGIGTLSCVFNENTNIKYFEIDEAVKDIAESQYFSYLKDCDNNKSFVIGDARIKMLDEANKKYDLIVIDAFSSDAIPAHLLTFEFIETLKDKVKENGLLIFHISNRHLDLSPILSKIAHEAHLESMRCTTPKSGDFAYETRVVVLGEDLRVLTDDNCWRETKHNDKTPFWTDNYNSIFEIMNTGDL